MVLNFVLLYGNPSKRKITQFDFKKVGDNCIFGSLVFSPTDTNVKAHKQIARSPRQKLEESLEKVTKFSSFFEHRESPVESLGTRSAVRGNSEMQTANFFGASMVSVCNYAVKNHCLFATSWICH